MTQQRVAVAVLSLLIGTGLVAAHPGSAQEDFARLLQDVSLFRGRGFTLPLPEGVPARYSRRMEDVSEARYATELAALTAFATRLTALDRSALPPGVHLDAEILHRQLRDRVNELRFRAFEMPIGRRDGFHFNLPGLADRSPFTTVGHYDNYIAQLQSWQQHTRQRILAMRLGLASGRTMPRALLVGYDAPVAEQLVDDVTTSALYAPFDRLPATFP
jgi:uncharacterized protein (DUF885 family)